MDLPFALAQQRRIVFLRWGKKAESVGIWIPHLPQIFFLRAALIKASTGFESHLEGTRDGAKVISCYEQWSELKAGITSNMINRCVSRTYTQTQIWSLPISIRCLQYKSRTSRILGDIKMGNQAMEIPQEKNWNFLSWSQARVITAIPLRPPPPVLWSASLETISGSDINIVFLGCDDGVGT